MSGARYRKTQKDLTKLDPNSREYWEEVLRREGLSMSRGQYPQKLRYGWRYRDRDGQNADDYSEESQP